MIGLQPSLISYNAAALACQKTAQWQYGLSILEDLSELKWQPSSITYDAVLNSCEADCRFKEVSEILACLQDEFSHLMCWPDPICAAQSKWFPDFCIIWTCGHSAMMVFPQVPGGSVAIRLSWTIPLNSWAMNFHQKKESWQAPTSLSVRQKIPVVLCPAQFGTAEECFQGGTICHQFQSPNLPVRDIQIWGIQWFDTRILWCIQTTKPQVCLRCLVVSIQNSARFQILECCIQVGPRHQIQIRCVDERRIMTNWRWTWKLVVSWHGFGAEA